MLDLGQIARLDKLLGPAQGCLMARCPWRGARLARLMQELPRGAPPVVRRVRGGGKTTKGGGETG